MATFSAVQRSHVLQAIEECDRRGPDDFLGVYGFVATDDLGVVHEGRRYDARAVLGVAHKYATGRLATPEEVSSGIDAAVVILRKRGFEVREPAAATRPVAARTATTRPARARATTARQPAARRVAAPDRPVALCPTCFMALPATGVCDQCG